MVKLAAVSKANVNNSLAAKFFLGPFLVDMHHTRPELMWTKQCLFIEIKYTYYDEKNKWVADNHLS